jgi:AraC family transcriptional activator of pobA
VAHGYRFAPDATDGWVLSFTEDAAAPPSAGAGDALGRLRALAAQPVVPIGDDAERARLSAWCAELFEEGSLARDGYRLAMRGLLVLIAVGVGRLAASRARTGSVTLQPADATVAQLRLLIDAFFRKERLLGFYAERLGISVDRLNDHVKRATGVTAGHLIRQRVLTEAKRQLVFTMQPIHDIANELAFADPSHFARFFRKHAGTTPHEFRDQRGG